MREVISIKLQPINFNLELTSIWSFQNRGNWATHSGSYRGNWSPYVPRNAGFKSKEIIIKEQHNCKSSKYWTKKFYPFLLLAHEYIFIFEK
ncbi:MAG: hypothetical protein PHP29_03895 [Tissierellia bacterium]|nr:hypothetical protein [Tissierellia bacterium]